MSGPGPSCSTVANIVTRIAGGLLLWLTGRLRVLARVEVDSLSWRLRLPATPMFTPFSYPLLHGGLAGCFGGGPAAHSTIIAIIP